MNYRQLQAVESDARRLVLLAGAGTGKTYTLLNRTLHLLKKGVMPGQILVLTFTRHAAAEFNSRFITAAPNHAPADRPIALTYHSFALHEITQDPRAFNLHFHSVYDPAQARQTFMQTCATVKHLYPDVDTPAPEVLLAAKHLAVCHDNVDEVKAKFPAAESFINGVFYEYDGFKREHGLVEFDDLMLAFHHRLQHDPPYAAALRNKIKHLLVDEFQDNNRLQDRIIRAIAAENICLVGDPNQSIYSWRGAAPGMIAEWIKTPGVKTLTLDLNYRSGSHIVSLANHLMGKTKGGITLRPTKISTEHVRELVAANPAEETDECLKWFLRPLAKGQTRAVIARTSFELELLQQKLDEKGVRYSKLLKEEREDCAQFFTALCRLASFPADQASYHRVAVALCGRQEADRLIDLLRQKHRVAFHGRLAAVPAVLSKLSNGEPGAADAAVELAQTSAQFGLKYEALNRIASEFKTNFAQAQTARMYVLGEFGSKKQLAPLTISTMHSAKGLEWNEVWLLGVGAKQLPHPKAKSEGRLDEERRLALVGITRARDSMVLSYPQKLRGQTQKSSPFIAHAVRR
ncbi:MAG: ATP-dependent helicase [Verrucomicrobiales bacterium]|nr:ATP-dependent helicase [Verrucomicrobiales bacterium]